MSQFIEYSRLLYKKIGLECAIGFSQLNLDVLPTNYKGLHIYKKMG